MMALLFLFGTTALGLATPGYDMVRQTVSEIDLNDSPMHVPFTGLLVLVASCALMFGAGLRQVARRSGESVAPAYLTAFLAIPNLGLAIFPARHPLHNLFGLLQAISFVGAPLSMSLAWRDKALVRSSWIAFGVVVLAVALNLAPAFSIGTRHLESHVYGLVQRALFLGWYGWCATVSFVLLTERASLRRTSQSPTPFS
jgi:hypothetical protein